MAWSLLQSCFWWIDLSAHVVRQISALNNVVEWFQKYQTLFWFSLVDLKQMKTFVKKKSWKFRIHRIGCLMPWASGDSFYQIKRSSKSHKKIRIHTYFRNCLLDRFNKINIACLVWIFSILYRGEPFRKKFTPFWEGPPCLA